jgi:hypothetical protein
VTGDQIQEWERLMRERVGLQRVGVEMLTGSGGSPSMLPTICFCGEQGQDACDCDGI